jgi:hypothetical protein
LRQSFTSGKADQNVRSFENPVNRQTIGYILIDRAGPVDFFRSVRRKQLGVSRSRLIVGIPSRCWTGCPMELDDGSTDRIVADSDRLQSDLDAEFEKIRRRAA